MDRIDIKARAKINLTLGITGKRDDGYHTVEMVMQSVSLCDNVSVVVSGKNRGIKLSCTCEGLPNDSSNLAYRAADVFYETVGIPVEECLIHIEKRIPVEAGLAGGSADAAAVLIALDSLHDTRLSLDALCDMGLLLGADVPYCIRRGTMLAEGIGDKLTRLPSLPVCWAVLCKPGFSISTKEAYAAFDRLDGLPKPDTKGVIEALESGDLAGACARLSNQLEAVAVSHPEIEEIKAIMCKYGASGALMSGSGPTVYGLFAERANAEEAKTRLLSRYKDTFLTHTV